MRLTVNGRASEVPDGTSLPELVESLGLRVGSVVVEHNGIALLRDAGYSDDEALRWLTTPDDTLPGTPLQALHENRATEIKRRAQALGF